MSEEKEILPVKTELQKKENLIFRAFKKIKNMDKIFLLKSLAQDILLYFFL